MANRTCTTKNPCSQHNLEALRARRAELEQKRATAQALVESTAVAAAVDKAHVAVSKAHTAINRASASVPRAYSEGVSDGKSIAVAAYKAQSWWDRLMNHKPEGF